jgi:ABC-type branched-subunit amino acid transport system ATPase component
MELLRVTDLSINFGGVLAVNKVGFTLNVGETLGIIGPNGSGKTTLFNLLSGIYPPTEGEITLNGSPIQGRPPDQVFELGVARTFQNGRLFWNLNVVENVVMGLADVRRAPIFSSLLAARREARRKRQAIDKALRIMGIFGQLLISQADKLAKDLPYADRRRLEFCRAIASEPKVLLLDEPSAGMDSLETERLMQDILKVRKSLPELSIIVVEHDMGFIKRLVDKVMVLNYGESIACGSFAEVAGDTTVINAYLGQGEKQ